jgi:serine/threonine-protein kinase
VSPSLVGSTVGHIRLEALLGAGGMGEVYRGRDQTLERTVAVKTIRAENRLSEDAKARFLREARILSKLAHPGICQIYDLIQDEAADLLVLEYVDGVTLDDLLADRRPTETEALELAVRIAEALAAAHRERVVHRDLKPANIMVTAGGGVKVLDFGLARPAAVEAGAVAAPAPATAAKRPRLDADGTHVLPSEPAPADSANSAQLTQHGTLVGTLRYMSPEQAAGAELTEASDLFSLGIVLQEMLTGRPAYAQLSPFDLLLSVVRGEALPIEGVDPDVARLVEDLKHPVPARRPSAATVVERLHWLLGKPQRLRRRRLRLAAAAAAFAALVVVLVVVSVLALRAERARGRAVQLAGELELEAQRASREARTARQVTAFLVELFDEADPEQARGREVTVREVVARGGERIASRLAAEPLVQAELQNALGAISWRLGDLETAASLLERALATVERDGEGASVAEVLSHLGAVYADQQRFDDARLALTRARTLLEGLADPPAGDLARVHNSLGTVALRAGDFGAAGSHFERALELGRSAPTRQPREIAGTLNNLAVLAWQNGDYATAERRLRESLEMEEARLGAGDPGLVAPLNNLGILMRDLGRFAEAETLHRRALTIAEKTLGPNHPDVASILSSLARLHGRTGRPLEGIAMLERALAIARDSYGARHAETGTVLVRLGDLERSAGRPERARRLVDEGLAVLRAALGEDHPRLVEALVAAGRVRRDLHRPREAAEIFRRAERIGIAGLGAGHPDVVAVRTEIDALEPSAEPLPRRNSLENPPHDPRLGAGV